MKPLSSLYFSREGTNSELPVIATGSHTDAIPYSGKYDGVVGVLGAIEAINVLRRLGFNPNRSLEVIMFTSEEPTRFGIGCLGSRLLAGSMTRFETLEGLVDNQNISFAEAAKAAGYHGTLGNLDGISLEKGAYSGFVELHIEQGPLLEEEGIPIGIVTAIAAPASIRVDFTGNGGHAGAVLMPYRRQEKAFMLKRIAEEPLGHATAIVAEVLENAECGGVINAAQKRVLLQEMALRLT